VFLLLLLLALVSFSLLFDGAGELVPPLPLLSRCLSDVELISDFLCKRFVCFL